MLNNCTSEDDDIINNETARIKTKIHKILKTCDQQLQLDAISPNIAASNMDVMDHQVATTSPGNVINEIIHVSKKKKRTRASRKLGKDNIRNSSKSVSSSRVSVDSSNKSQKPFMSPENYLIYQLLNLNLFEREKLLVKLAKERKILVPNKHTKQFEINPILSDIPSELANDKNLVRGSGQLERKLSGMQITVAQTSNTQHQQKQTRSNHFTRRQRSQKFEDQVNHLLYGIHLNDHVLLKNNNLSHDNNSFLTKQNQINLEEFIKKLLELELGTIQEGILRINAKNSHESYVTVSNEMKDIYISTQVLRQTALHGDLVLVFIKKFGNNNLSTSSTGEQLLRGNNDEKKIGFIVKIIEKKHPRECVGTISVTINENKRSMILIPRDLRVPNIRISEANGLRIFKQMGVTNFTDKLFLVQILDWQNNIPNGKILMEIGKCGLLAAENQAILLTNSFDPKPFSQEILTELPEIPYKIPEMEFTYREDLRHKCIFTIDPLTARDLDDAVSFLVLENDNYEIGVHISDVAYFIHENSTLDNKIKEQATSIYMVDRVYHMLPESLCLLCSLLPGEDKLSFSVFWEMTKTGEIVNTRFCRSIVNSCAKLAYEHAQIFIENPTQTDYENNDFPQIFNGFTINDLKESILQLQSIALKLREKRHKNGALRIDQPKINFKLDDYGNPISYSPYEAKDSNRLIEEFMLLANSTVAEFTFLKYKDLAILRNHFEPINLDKFQEKFINLGIEFNSSSSMAIKQSIENVVEKNENKEATLCILNHLCAKQMTRASYFCSADGDGDNIRWHYALSISIYTHFTSPIRRYPDILVHRLLAAALDLQPVPKRSPEELKNITNNCNVQKYNAKLTGEDCTKLYFIHFIKSIGTLKMRAAVLNVQEYSMDILLIETGYQIKMTYSKMKSTLEFQYNANIQPATIKIISKDSAFPSFKLSMFSECLVEIEVDSHQKLTAIIVPQLQEEC